MYYYINNFINNDINTDMSNVSLFFVVLDDPDELKYFINFSKTISNNIEVYKLKSIYNNIDISYCNRINNYNNSSNNFFRAAFAESILSPNILGRINLTKGLQTNKVYKKVECSKSYKNREYKRLIRFLIFCLSCQEN